MILRRAAVLVPVLAAASWITAALLTAGHGFDTSDEGFYLLSYRWWDDNLRTFTGAQYVYGPLFEALGHNIAALRILRLFTVVGAHLVFGRAFMGWLRRRRPAASSSRLWEASGCAALLACGGLVYAWLPPTPGYNDISLLGGLLAAAIVLRMATDVEKGRTPPAWVPALLGPVAVVTLLAKWSSAVVVLAVAGGAAVAVVWPGGPRGVLRAGAWAAAGAAVTLLAFQFLVVPLTSAVPAMLDTSKLVAARTNSPLALVGMYARTGGEAIGLIVLQHGPLLLAAVLAAVAKGRRARRAAAALAVAGGTLSLCLLVGGGALRGGAENLQRYSAGVLTMVAVAAVIAAAVLSTGRRAGAGASSLGRESRSGRAVLLMLAALPLAQGFGTGNPLHYMAVNSFAAWAALIIVVATGIEGAPRAARWTAAAAAAGVAVLPAAIAIDGMWVHPYRSPGRAETTAVAAGVPALDSVRLDPRAARRYERLRASLRPYLVPEGRAMMAFDEMAGIVLLLGGRPVGEAWYSGSDHRRTAAGIRAECRDGRPWGGTRRPILLFNRPVSATELGALRACGLVFGTDYRRLPIDGAAGELQVYVPVKEN